MIRHSPYFYDRNTPEYPPTQTVPIAVPSPAPTTNSTLPVCDTTAVLGPTAFEYEVETLLITVGTRLTDAHRQTAKAMVEKVKDYHSTNAWILVNDHWGEYISKIIMNIARLSRADLLPPSGEDFSWVLRLVEAFQELEIHDFQQHFQWISTLFCSLGVMVEKQLLPDFLPLINGEDSFIIQLTRLHCDYFCTDRQQSIKHDDASLTCLLSCIDQFYYGLYQLLKSQLVQNNHQKPNLERSAPEAFKSLTHCLTLFSLGIVSVISKSKTFFQTQSTDKLMLVMGNYNLLCEAFQLQTLIFTPAKYEEVFLKASTLFFKSTPVLAGNTTPVEGTIPEFLHRSAALLHLTNPFLLVKAHLTPEVLAYSAEYPGKLRAYNSYQIKIRCPQEAEKLLQQLRIPEPRQTADLSKLKEMLVLLTKASLLKEQDWDAYLSQCSVSLNLGMR